MIKVFKWIKGINKGEVLKLKNGDITRSNGFKLDKFTFRKDIGKHWFGNRVVNMWNGLPRAVISTDTVESFKRKLDSHMDDNYGMGVNGSCLVWAAWPYAVPCDTCVS